MRSMVTWYAVLWGVGMAGCAVDRTVDPVRNVTGGPDGGAADAGSGGSDAGGGGSDAGSGGSDACTPVTWYVDCDGDGYPDDGAASQDACAPPSGVPEGCTGSAGRWVEAPSDGWDCDDGDADIHPGADERCNGVDDDCDGETDESDALDALTWYLDDDGDTYGRADGSVRACERPGGYVNRGGDCDDGDADIHPGAQAPCNGVDDDCDGLVDDMDELSSDKACTGSDYANHTCTVRHWRSEEGGTGAAYLFCQGTRHGWQLAWGDCTRNDSGYRLVAIESLEEQAWIEGQIDTLSDGWDRDWWIGARDNVDEDWAAPYKSEQQQWFWMATRHRFCANSDADANGCTAVDGAYTHWGPPDPNRGGDCAVLSRGNGMRIQGAWYDRNCGDAYWFICESPPAGGPAFPPL